VAFRACAPARGFGSAVDRAAILHCKLTKMQRTTHTHYDYKCNFHLRDQVTFSWAAFLAVACQLHCSIGHILWSFWPIASPEIGAKWVAESGR